MNKRKWAYAFMSLALALLSIVLLSIFKILHVVWYLLAVGFLIIGILKFCSDKNLAGGILKNRESLWWFCSACCFVFCGSWLRFPDVIPFALSLLFLFPLFALYILFFVYFDIFLHRDQ